jgi:hypothetical protein
LFATRRRQALKNTRSQNLSLMNLIDAALVVLGLGLIPNPPSNRKPDPRSTALRPPLAIRRRVVMRPVAFRKMRGAGEAAGQRDVDDAHIRLQQQVPRLLQAKLHVIALGGAVEVAGEQAFQLAGGHAHILG